MCKQKHSKMSLSYPHNNSNAEHQVQHKQNRQVLPSIDSLLCGVPSASEQNLPTNGQQAIAMHSVNLQQSAPSCFPSINVIIRSDSLPTRRTNQDTPVFQLNHGITKKQYKERPNSRFKLVVREQCNRSFFSQPNNSFQQRTESHFLTQPSQPQN